MKNDLNHKFLLYVKNDYELKDNTVISIFGEFKKPDIQRNSGGFDNSKYMYSQGFYGSVFVNDVSNIEVLEQGRFNLINFIQNNIFETLGKLFPKDQLGILLGMMIGDTFYVSNEIEEAFRLSGVTHLLAVSGSNVTYIILVVKIFFKKIFGKQISNYLTIMMIILFVLVSGATSSVVRAGIMAIILILSDILSRAPTTISTVATTAIVILLYNPLIICDVGFLLSFGGTLGIILLNNPILEWFNKKNVIISQNRIVNSILEMFCVTLSAQIILIPIMIYYFNSISLISLLTNLLVGPFTGTITVLGLIIYFLSLIFQPLGKLLSYSVYILISLIILISKICSKVPFANITVTTPWFSFIIIYYLCVYLIYTKLLNFNNKTRDKIIKTIISILIIISVIINIVPANYLEINFIDVGQGDSALIKTNNCNILIDGGGTENSDYNIGKQVLVPYLLDNTNGIIDVMFISHFHEDHAEGCISVIESLKVKKIIIGTQPKQTDLYTNVLKLAKIKSIPIITMNAGDSIKIDDVEFKILFPGNEIELEGDLNNNSLVIRMEYYKSSMLFTGDIEKEAEKLLLSDKGYLLDVDILKVAHHGSKTSSFDSFIEEVTPKIALIGVGNDNKFGHPAEEVVERLEKYGAQIYRTNECGEIRIKINKKGKVSLKTCIKKQIS